MTGNCVHKLHGHAATVTAVTCTSLYVISVGMDDQLCIWERSKGHLLHWIQMASYPPVIVLFSPVTAFMTLETGGPLLTIIAEACI